MQVLTTRTRKLENQQQEAVEYFHRLAADCNSYAPLDGATIIIADNMYRCHVTTAGDTAVRASVYRHSAEYRDNMSPTGWTYCERGVKVAEFHLSPAG